MAKELFRPTKLRKTRGEVDSLKFETPTLTLDSSKLETKTLTRTPGQKPRLPTPTPHPRTFEKLFYDVTNDVMQQFCDATNDVQRSIMYAGVKLWNDLPLYLREMPFSNFKDVYQNLLISCY